MSDQQSTSNATQRLRAFDTNMRRLVDAAMRDYYSPLRPDETLDDRSELIHDELWSALARALVAHAQPQPTRDATDHGILDYVAACVNQQRHADGLPALRARGVVRVPIVGVVVADERMGNRVTTIDGVPA